jgi:hypothetical protein
MPFCWVLDYFLADDNFEIVPVNLNKKLWSLSLTPEFLMYMDLLCRNYVQIIEGNRHRNFFMRNAAKSNQTSGLNSGILNTHNLLAV